MALSIIRIVLFASSLWGVQSLAITNLTVPAFVENGTQEYVLLDCEYNYDEKDTNLVVKWFHNSDPVPVYQWIPEEHSIATTTKFQDRVSADYNVGTGDKITEYRALHMQWPTTEMSGKYSCQVTSMAGIAAREAHMTIYAKPKSISINVTTVDDTVYVTCIVENVFPVPKVEISHTEPGQMDAHPVEAVHLSDVKDGDAFDVFVTTNISQSELESGSLHFFGCTVTLVGTEYIEEKSTPFHFINLGHRPGLRRKIHSEDYMVHHGNNPEVLNLDDYNFLNVVAAETDQRDGEESGEDNDNGDGALNMLPSLATILSFASALLLLSW